MIPQQQLSYAVLCARERSKEKQKQQRKKTCEWMKWCNKLIIKYEKEERWINLNCWCALFFPCFVSRWNPLSVTKSKHILFLFSFVWVAMLVDIDSPNASFSTLSIRYVICRGLQTAEMEKRLGRDLKISGLNIYQISAHIHDEL